MYYSDSSDDANKMAASFRALLDYYANVRSAASHIVSLTLLPLTNQTLETENASSSTSSNTSSGGKSSTNRSAIYEEDDEFAANNFFAVTERIATEASIALSGTVRPSKGSTVGTDMPAWLIPSYSVILCCAIVGNLLVISTLMQNRRMRTITNLFLLNLAISDMLLGVLCMPVTLVGTLLRNFIFGAFLCKLIQFAQAASVAVSSWTLVAISCERYYAICHPLRSRSWQTISHAYKIIGFIWLSSILCMAPIAVFSQLIPTSRAGYCKCREHWPDQGYERFYNLMLDLILLVLPLLVLCVAYILITRTLYVGMDAGKETARMPTHSGSGSAQTIATTVPTTATPGSSNCILVQNAITNEYTESSNNNNGGMTSTTTTATATMTLTTTATTTTTTSTTVTLAKSSNASPSIRIHDATLRRSNETKTLESKKRVVKMLFVLVLEFFICWTPLYVINTLSMFIGQALYEYIDYTSISFLQLLAYSSSCCNPITYCFMNASFRRAFVDTFKGLPWKRRGNAAAGLSASQAGMPNVPGLAIGMDTWRTRSRNEQLLNSVVYTNSAAAGATADSPNL